eukprot:scaffold7313_cov144-Skeletonema_menzelii.AAC.8
MSSIDESGMHGQGLSCLWKGASLIADKDEPVPVADGNFCSAVHTRSAFPRMSRHGTPIRQ